MCSNLIYIKTHNKLGKRDQTETQPKYQHIGDFYRGTESKRERSQARELLETFALNNILTYLL